MRLILSLAAALVGLAPLSAAPLAVPPIAFTTRTLANGLRIYELPDKSGATASVQVWYDVGSKDDPTGRSGFAHLFEHLMFKATRDMPAETFDRLTEDVGGSNNASTDDDYTEYHETVPANHLERLIWAEAERMGSLVVDQANFVSEREVVKEELRGDLARPYGPLFSVDFAAANYTTHPYARATIGSIADLDRATLEDVRAFHALYYRPDNAVLVVSGNFDPAQLDRWIDRYLAPIARPAWPIPRVAAIEPPRDGARRYEVRAPNTPLPAVVLSWLIPPSSDKDHAVLNMIDAVLSGGESARLNRDLVYRDRIASEADVTGDFKKGTGTLSIFAVMASGHGPAEGEAALRREVARLRDAPVTEAELARVRNLIVTSALKQRETAEGRASILASGVLVENDPRAADRRLAAIQHVTAADIRRVARALLPDDRTVTIHYLAPDAARPQQSEFLPLAPTVMTAALSAPAGIPIITAAAVDARLLPPPPGTAVAPVLPVPIERRLANGMRLVLLPRQGLPIVTAHLVSRSGSAADPSGRAGLASLATDLLTKGTTSRSATAISDAIESLGGGIGGNAARDGSTLTLTVRSDQLTPAMAIFADVALHPAFARSELDRARSEALDDLVQTYRTPTSLARLVAARAVYGDAPYGRPSEGTPLSLRAITRADLLASYHASWRPDTTTLVMAGDITVDHAMRLAATLFGGWRSPPTPPIRQAPAMPLPRPRIIVVDFPDTDQAAVLISRATITRADPDYYPMLVANAALGGGYSSRLNREVRVKRGLAYGANSSFSAGTLPGPLNVSTQTKNATAADVVGIMADEMRRLGTESIPADELAARKAALTGGFGDAIETTDGLAGVVAGLVEHAIDPAEIGHYAQRVTAVDATAVERVAARLLDPATASVVIVGKAELFVPALKAKGLDPDVIPAVRLQFDTATLR